MQIWDCLFHQLLPHLPQSVSISSCELSLPWLPISAPPTGLDEYFFFNSLPVRFPYSSIFWQFWLFSVLKFVVVLLLAVRGSTVCLPMRPSWPEVLSFPFDWLGVPFLFLEWLLSPNSPHPFLSQSSNLHPQLI